MTNTSYDVNKTFLATIQICGDYTDELLLIFLSQICE